MKLLWMTDIHLNFLVTEERQQFYLNMKNDVDAIAICGDIAEATSVIPILEEMATHINKPIYFVLGNHDYYRGKINDVREAMRVLTRQHPLLFWLGACDPIQLDNETLLVGQDGWADGRYGDYANSPVTLNDSFLIADLFQKRLLSRVELLEKMQQLADEDANNLYTQLRHAATQPPKKMIVLTHVPPFKEATRHEGRISSDDYLPFFGAKATGDVLMKFATEHPEIDILVLCGHTHDGCQYHPLDNLTVYVGKAEYLHPCVQRVIDTEKFKS